MDENRLTQLLNLYLDGNLTASDRQELEQQLLASPAARRHFWKYTSLHAFTLEAAQLKWSEHAKESIQKSKADARPGLTLMEHALAWLSAWRWTWARALAMSAAVLLIFALIAVGYANRSVATLARAVDVEWTDARNPPLLGADLKKGWLHLKQGAVELTFNSGAQVVFEAPADIYLVSEMEAHCTLGRFRAHVPPEAHGFKLSVDSLNVVDLGTEFGLSVPPTGSAEVHVFTGRVQVSRNAQDAPKLDVLEGEAVKAEGAGFSHLDANEAGFLKDAELARRGLPGLEQQRAAWRAASRALTMDPAAILHYTFLDQPSWASVVSNQVSSATVDSHGAIEGCEWAEGRWPGKKALRFKGAEDRVRLNLPQNLKSFTSLMWLRVDYLTNSFLNSLMTCDREGPGSLRWTLSREGKVRLGLANDSPNPEANWIVGMSPPAVTTNRLGQWVMIATTYDGKKMAHYLDGQEIWAGQVVGPGTLSFDWVEIGNWVARPDHPAFAWAKDHAKSFFDRNFQGAIDEVAVLSRVVTGDEMKRLYELGRPIKPVAFAAANSDAERARQKQKD